MATDDTKDVVNVQPDVPSVTPKSGYQTSQGQMTAIFTLVCMVISLLGFHYTPEQFQDWVDRAEHVAAVVVPLITAMVPMISYINSRGKIASNTLWANAQIKIAAMNPAQPRLIEGAPLTAMQGFVSGPRMDLQGHDWKDPERYGSLIHIAKELGVPGASSVDSVNQAIHPADLILGILAMLKHKSDK